METEIPGLVSDCVTYFFAKGRKVAESEQLMMGSGILMQAVARLGVHSKTWGFCIRLSAMETRYACHFSRLMLFSILVWAFGKNGSPSSTLPSLLPDMDEAIRSFLQF